ncbi:MAG: cysteine desulfurase family protein [Parvibaculales bacterium]
MSRRVYLDYNATAPVRPPVVAAMSEALAVGGNASSIHAEGREARSLIEKARQQVCNLIGADMAGLVFTSGGTEACNLAVKTRTAPAGDIKRIIVSAIEHAAVMAPVEASGLPLEQVGVTGNGVVDLDALDRLLEDPAPALVCVMAANNETGVIQPVAEIGEKVRAHGSVFFCDAVQAAGKIPVSMWHMNVDLLSLSAHKLGGPAGVGALAAAPHIVTGTQLVGGGQELSRRAGTENLAGIVGFGAAAELVAKELEQSQQLADWRDDMEERLLEAVPEAVVFGREVARLPNTSCFAAPGCRSEMMVIAMDLNGFAVSAGAACSSGKVTRSHVLDAMGVADHLSEGAIRLSLGWQSQATDGPAFVEALKDKVDRSAHA